MTHQLPHLPRSAPTFSPTSLRPWWAQRTPAAKALLIVAAAVLPLFVCCGGLTVAGALNGKPEPDAAPASTAGAPSPSTSPSPTVVTRTVTGTEAIPFDERTVEDSSLPEGTREVRTEGRAGVRTITYEVTIIDGVETDRRRVRAEVTREPVERVIVEGTRRPEPEPEPDAEPSCHPSYDGPCVPYASDVDCAGGSGDGPAYVQGPVYIVGSDPYDLDRDGDGVACE